MWIKGFQGLGLKGLALKRIQSLDNQNSLDLIIEIERRKVRKMKRTT